MDNIDYKILKIIQNNATASYQSIGKELDIGTSTVHYRINKMKKQGIITSMSAILDPEKIGFDATAVIGLNVEPLKMDEIAEHLSSFDEVQTVATSSGNHDRAHNYVKDLLQFLLQHPCHLCNAPVIVAIFQRF